MEIHMELIPYMEYEWSGGPTGFQNTKTDFFRSTGRRREGIQYAYDMDGSDGENLGGGVGSGRVDIFF